MSRKPETELSAAICSFLRAAGYSVYSLEQGYRKEPGGTRQTPGIADLYIIGHGRYTWAELKVGKRKLTMWQQVFEKVCKDNDVRHTVWRHLNDAVEWHKGGKNEHHDTARPGQVTVESTTDE